jgi:hypothetical protein
MRCIAELGADVGASLNGTNAIEAGQQRQVLVPQLDPSATQSLLRPLPVLACRSWSPRTPRPKIGDNSDRRSLGALLLPCM